MSAWPIPEEVVEAFATVGCRCAPGGCAAHGCEECRAAAIDFLTRHRLVQLPEEPTATVWTEDGGDIVDVEIGTDLVEGENHLYRIPGQPITVDKEENEAPGGAS